MEVALPGPDRDILLSSFDKARARIEALLPKIDPHKEIYPGWTLKDILAHMTGWDDVTIDTLRSHVANGPLTIPTIRNLDEFNALTVSSHKNMDYEPVLKEWRHTRHVLHTILEQLTEDEFLRPVMVPWGRKAPVTSLVNIFRKHEEEHARDIQAWLKHPDEQLKKEGN
jgi:hypothetical protein